MEDGPPFEAVISVFLAETGLAERVKDPLLDEPNMNLVNSLHTVVFRIVVIDVVEFMIRRDKSMVRVLEQGLLWALVGRICRIIIIVLLFYYVISNI